MKKIVFSLMCMGLSFAAAAQISTGEPSSTTIRTGNRAAEGDFGLYLGAVYNYINVEGADDYFNSLPLINLKYMQSDNIEFRFGIELNKTSHNEVGTIENEDGGSFETQNKQIRVDHAIYPGFAYHFAKSNILDVYAGVELPLGYERHNITEKWDGDNGYGILSKTCFNVGVGGFIGLQAYVANLPLAIGVEWGIFSRWDIGQQYKMTTKESKGSDEIVRYFPTFDDARLGTNAYDELSVRDGKVGNQIRLTISYFFK
jgi:hypothetical protein